jgi:hypothetical protein
MNPEIEELFGKQGGVATSSQILLRMTRRQFENSVNCGVLERMPRAGKRVKRRFWP